MNIQHLLYAFVFALTGFAATGFGQEAIKPYDKNPRYWQYEGQPVLLLGASGEDSLFQWGKNPEKLRAHLDKIEGAGGNYVRNTMSSRNEPQGDVHAFKRLENGKYELDQWNPEYWRRFELLLDETNKRNIFVSIELWDGHDYQSRTKEPEGNPEWSRHPYNPVNNVNYKPEQTTLPKKWTAGYKKKTHPIFKTVPALNDDTRILQYQLRFIGKVLDHALKYDHVLYVIQNESWADESWSNYWREFIREKADERNKEVYIGDMRRYGPQVSPVLEHDFDFAEISQSGGLSGQDHFDAIAEALAKLNPPVPANSVKQYGSNKVGWTDGAEEGMARLWRSIFGGQAAVRDHRPPAGLGLSDRAQAHIRSLRQVTDMVTVFTAQPHQQAGTLLEQRKTDEAYIMADPGRAYAIYFPDGGTVSLDISAIDDEAYLRWRNPDTAEWKGDWTQHESQKRIRLEAPGNSDWVALVASEPNLDED